MPSWRELRRFCERDGWELLRETDHYFYQKRNNDGTKRYTRVSKGSGEIGHGLWKRILTQQLQVSKEYFNSKL
jgi:hypothetical protein